MTDDADPRKLTLVTDESDVPVLGRPRLVRRPTLRHRQRVAAQIAECDVHADRDAVVGLVRGDAPTVELLRQIQSEAAVEAASLGWLRRQLTAGTLECQRASTRRIRCLAEVARLELEIQSLGSEAVDTSSPIAQRVLAMLVSAIDGVVREVLPADVAERFVAEWHGRLRGVREFAGLVDHATAEVESDAR